MNHFWRLLNGLNIPYLTLLDFDREREGAGWGRIQYIRNQLVALDDPSNPEISTLADKKYETLDRNNAKDTVNMTGWIDYFREKFGIFLVEPLDLDFAMLEAFPRVYKTLTRGSGPRLPKKNSAEYATTLRTRVHQVLASAPEIVDPSLGSTYTDDQKELFPWYKYLFLDGSKPVTHMRALINISDDNLCKDAPEVLRALIEKAREEGSFDEEL